VAYSISWREDEATQTLTFSLKNPMGIPMRKYVMVALAIVAALSVAGCAGKGKAPILGKGKAPVVQTKG
jgi:hypothetical protein